MASQDQALDGAEGNAQPMGSTKSPDEDRVTRAELVTLYVLGAFAVCGVVVLVLEALN